MRKALFFPSLIAIFFAQSISAQYNLTLNFENMDPHVGQRFEVRVVDKSDSTEVGRQVIKVITSDSFTVELFVLLVNRSYNVDFYADLNGNGEYDAPPMDHAWRRTVDNVTQDVVIDFSHVTNFTDIELPDVYDFSFYEATWGGKWMNLTFGSTDTIQANIQIACDSFNFSSITSGLFGNPDTVIFEFRDTVPANFDPACDTMTIKLTDPLTGTLTLFNGMMTGDFLEPGTGIGLQFAGNYGAGQQLFQYMVLNNGVPFANGFSYVRELEVHADIPPLELSVVDIVDVDCAGINDGAATLATLGGVEPISFDWSDGGTGISRTDLAGGSYGITATDINGCIDTVTIVITEPEVLFFSLIELVQVTCFGGSDGVIEVSAIGGCPPYFYGINVAEFSVSGVFPDLSAGTYNVAVMDSKGCISFVQVNVLQAEEIQPMLVATDETSVGANDGTASSSPVGGTPPYTLMWSTGETTDTISGLSPGNYVLSVTDAIGCIVIDSVVVAPFVCSMTVVIAGITATCPGDSVVLTANASSDPVTYVWSDGSTGSAIEVGVGTYGVTVSDEFGCTATVSIVVVELSTVVVDTIIVTHEQGGNGDGTIEVFISGGQPPFAYSWTKDDSFFSSDKDLVYLSAGTYCLLITDSNGCTIKTDTILLENTTSLTDLSQHFRIYPNPASSFLRIESDFTWSARMIDPQGREVMDIGMGNSERISVSSLHPGVYFLILSDGESTLTRRIVVQR